MYDACNYLNIPKGVMAAGYLNGICKWPAAAWVKFPQAVQICTNPILNIGVVLDVETGDATPQNAPAWVAKRRAAGVDPTVYMNASTWPAVIAAFKADGVTEPHYWVAHYDGIATIPAGAIAKQYRNSVAPGYDLSIVADYWPGVDSEVTVTTAEQVAALYSIFFEPFAAGAAPWSNAEVLRRMLVQLGATYNQPNGLPFVPLPGPTTGGGLSAAEQAALAQIPVILAKLTAIEAALKSA
jgi:hypothetical protein